jgi:hypothetical protein
VLAACAGAPPAPPPGPTIDLAERPLYVAPIEDPERLVPDEQLVLLNDELREAIRLWQAGERKRKRPAPELVSAPAAGARTLRVTVGVWLPRGHPMLALTIGIGQGRPGFEATIALEQDGAAIRTGTIEETSSRFTRDPQGPDVTCREALVEAAMDWLTAR